METDGMYFQWVLKEEDANPPNGIPGFVHSKLRWKMLSECSMTQAMRPGRKLWIYQFVPPDYENECALSFKENENHRDAALDH
ncbi:hypothetical protein CEXT_781241 [Caerostris extrusa]|uniref:Uncharacterized protein n=1 Tax=Caerostris extrusa TaxID=172846 RepID=A0AAV4UFJ1_CAEEX|nr:hypothetical protein CEXT_781241 [Caerostris extrusa]